MLNLYLMALGLVISAPLYCQESAPIAQNDSSNNQTVRNTVLATTEETPLTELAAPEQKVEFASRAKGQLSSEEKKANLDYCRKILADQTTDVNSSTPSGIPVLEFLSILYLNNLPVEGELLQLLARGADVNITSSYKKTALYYLVCYTVCPELFEKIQSERSITTTQEIDTSKKETANNKDTTHKTVTSEEKEDTPSQSVLRDKATNLQVIELLLYFGANPLIGDENGVTPIHLALSKKDSDILNLFVKYGWIQIVEESEEQTAHDDDKTEASLPEEAKSNDTATV